MFLPVDLEAAKLYGITGDRVIVIDATTNEITKTVHLPAGASFTSLGGGSLGPDLRTAYIVTYPAGVVAYDTATDTFGRWYPILPSDRRVQKPGVTPDQKTMFVVDQDGAVWVVDLATGNTLGTIGVPPQNFDGAVSRDGAKFYVPSRDAGNISVISTATRSVIKTMQPAVYPTFEDFAALFSVSPETLAELEAYWLSLAPDEQLALYLSALPPESPEGYGGFGYQIGAHDIVLSSDGTRGYVTNEYSNSFSCLDLTNDTVIKTIQVEGTAPIWLALSPDNRTVYTSNTASKSISIIDAASCTKIGSISDPVAGMKLRDVELSANGQFLYVGGGNEPETSLVPTIAVYDLTGPVPTFVKLIHPETEIIHFIRSSPAVPEAVALSKLQRIASLAPKLFVGFLVGQAVKLVTCSPTGPAVLACVVAVDIVEAVALLGKVTSVLQFAVILDDPPDPNFSMIFVPQDYAPPTVRPQRIIPRDLQQTANATLAKLTDVYELAEAWRVTLERYSAAVAAADSDAADLQLAALEDYIRATSGATTSAKSSLDQLVTDLQALMGPIQVEQSDIEAAQALLARGDGFSTEEQQILRNLGLSQDDINTILAAVLAVNPAEVPTELLLGLRLAADGYGELSEVTSCVAGFCAMSVDNAKVEIEDKKFEVKGRFTLSGRSNGIDPLAEDVTFRLGDLVTTIPGTSFRLHPPKPGKKGSSGRLTSWTFDGIIAGLKIEAKITDFGEGSFEFKAEGKTKNKSTAMNPLILELTIGDDIGLAWVNAKFE